jgi:hypothetical protein
MTAANDNVIPTLNNSIDTCEDGQYGFGSAAEHVKDLELQRGRPATELPPDVQRQGGDPERPPHSIQFQRDHRPADVPIGLETFFGLDWLALRTSPIWYGLGVPRG